MPVLVCSLDNVVFDVSFARSIERWRAANNGGVLGVDQPGGLDDDALRSFEVGLLGESEYARHLRARLRWHGGDPALVEIFNEAFGPVDLDVVQLLGELRREGWYLVGVINTNPWHEPVWRRRYPEALSVFHRVLSSTQLRLRLPAHRVYTEALRESWLEGLRLYVGDRQESVAGARAAGLEAHLFRGAAGMRAACQSLAAPAL